MKLRPLNVIPPKYIHIYVLRITFMSGDANAYETKEYAVSHDDACRCLTFLQALQKLRREGGRRCPYRLGTDSWKTLPCAYIVDGCYPWDHKYEALDPKPIIEWGNDTPCEGISASLDRYAITWYDLGGNEHEVEIIP